MTMCVSMARDTCFKLVFMGAHFGYSIFGAGPQISDKGSTRKHVLRATNIVRRRVVQGGPIVDVIAVLAMLVWILMMMVASRIVP